MVWSFGLSDPFLQSVRMVAPNSPLHVGQIDPLVRGHFELLRLRGGPLDGADVPVISGHLVRGRQRESRLQIGLVGCSSRSTFANSTRLPASPAESLMVWTKLEPSASRDDFDGHARRAVFHHPNPRRSAHVRFGRAPAPGPNPCSTPATARDCRRRSPGAPERPAVPCRSTYRKCWRRRHRHSASRGSTGSRANCSGTVRASRRLPRRCARLDVVDRVADRRRSGHEQHLAA